MAIKKVYELSVDMKRTSVRVNVPVLVQGDSAEFRIRLADNGVALSAEELGGITSVTMQSGYDAQTIIETVGTLEGSTAVFRLQKGELFRSGTVQAMVQLADADDRISTLRFEYQVIPELSGNYIPGEQDITVFQRYINDAQAKIDEMAATDVSQLTAQLADKAEQQSVNTLNTLVSNKADKTFVESLIKSNSSGTPKVIVQEVSNLPAIGGTEKIALVLSNNSLYYDNGTNWISIGQYQAASVNAENVSFNSNLYANTDVKKALDESKEKFSGRVLKLVNSLHNMQKFSVSNKLDIPKNVVNNSIVEFEAKNSGAITNEINFNGFRSKGGNLFNKAAAIKGKYASHTTGQILNEPSQVMSHTIEITPDTDYSFGSEQGIRYGRMAFYDSSGVFISGIAGGILDGYISAKSPVNATRLIVSVSNAVGNVDVWQAEKGIGLGEYKNFIDETVLLDNPVRLIGHNNVSDTLNHEGVLVKKFGKVTMNGSSVWYFHESSATNHRFYMSTMDIAPNILKQVAGSGIGKSADGDFSIQASYTDSKGIAIAGNGNLFLTVPKAEVDGYEGATPLEKFKKYLAAFPVTLYYQLTTPLTELVKMNYPLAYNGGQFQLLTSVPSATDLKLSIQKPNNIVNSKTLIKLEEAGKSHFGGYAYTSFGGGVMVDGKEVYVLRNAKRHVTNTGDYGRTVAYIRDKSGQWSNKIVDLGFTNKEFRDIDLSLPFDGSRDILLSGCLFDGTTYENWLFRLDKDLNLISSEQIITEHDYFSWGNYLFSPSGVGMKTAYGISPTAGSRGVRLLRKNGEVYDDSVILFEGTSLLPTETTIGYWGEKLVAVCRQNAGFSLYRETTDLEGLTGWSEPKILDFKAHAPCLSPYTQAGEPLILTFSSVSPMISQTPKAHRDVSITATYDGINWHKEVVIAENNHYGGYNSFVKIGAGKYGMTYYDDYDNTKPNYKAGTDLYYEQVDVDRYLNDLEWFKYQRSLII